MADAVGFSSTVPPLNVFGKGYFMPMATMVTKAMKMVIMVTRAMAMVITTDP